MTRRMSAMAAVSLALLLPTSAVGQAPEYLLDVPDPEGDLAKSTGALIGEPAYMDIVTLRVEVDGDDLVAFFGVAGEFPDDFESVPTFEYGMVVDWDGADFWDWYSVVPEKDWAVFATGRSINLMPVAKAEVSTDQFVFRVPLPPSVSPEDLRFRGYMLAMKLPKLSDFVVVDGRLQYEPRNESGPVYEWDSLEDQIPDDKDGWVVFGASEASSQPSSRSEATGTDTGGDS